MSERSFESRSAEAGGGEPVDVDDAGRLSDWLVRPIRRSSMPPPRESGMPPPASEPSEPSSASEPSEPLPPGAGLTPLELDALASSLAASSVYVGPLLQEGAPLESSTKTGADASVGVVHGAGSSEPAPPAQDDVSEPAPPAQDDVSEPSPVLVQSEAFPVALPIHRPSRRAAVLALAFGAALAFLVASLLSKRHAREPAPRPAVSAALQPEAPAPAVAPPTPEEPPATESQEEPQKDTPTRADRRAGSPAPPASAREPEPGAPGGPSVGRFPDLPRDVLMQLEHGSLAPSGKERSGLIQSP